MNWTATGSAVRDFIAVKAQLSVFTLCMFVTHFTIALITMMSICVVCHALNPVFVLVLLLSVLALFLLTIISTFATLMPAILE